MVTWKECHCWDAAPAATERAKPKPLSREAWDARKPLPPDVLANALQDRVHADGPLISAAPVVTERAEEGCEHDWQWGDGRNAGGATCRKCRRTDPAWIIAFDLKNHLDAALRRAEAAEQDRAALLAGTASADSQLDALRAGSAKDAATIAELREEMTKLGCEVTDARNATIYARNDLDNVALERDELREKVRSG